MNVRLTGVIGLATLLAVAVVGYCGLRWLVSFTYPFSYRTTIQQNASANDLDPYLVAAVVRTESHFRARATSAQGARGLMQIMPETGAWVAKQLDLPFQPEMLYDPDYNLKIGCWYLAHLLKQFDGDQVLALAAYNGGQSNVMKWLQENQWTGEHQTLHQIPFGETRQYVANVLRDHKRYQLLYKEWPWLAGVQQGGEGHAGAGL